MHIVICMKIHNLMIGLTEELFYFNKRISLLNIKYKVLNTFRRNFKLLKSQYEERLKILQRNSQFSKP